MSEPVSGAPYIIICSIETEVAVADTRTKKIVAVSNGAERLISWMQSFYPNYDPHDNQTISTIQHQLMDFVRGEVQLTPQQVEQKIETLISEFRELEDKY